MKRRARTWKPVHPNRVQLRELPLKLLHSVHAYMVAEVESCGDGIMPEERPGYVALANVCEREIRRRRRAPIYKLPLPEAES